MRERSAVKVARSVLRRERCGKVLLLSDSEEVSVTEMERRGEQSISLSMSRIAEMTTSAVTNRVKDGQIKRDGKERTHGHR